MGPLPSDESLGYFHMSLRDKGIRRNSSWTGREISSAFPVLLSLRERAGITRSVMGTEVTRRPMPATGSLVSLRFRALSIALPPAYFRNCLTPSAHGVIDSDWQRR
jgi:hypothetical protein